MENPRCLIDCSNSPTLAIPSELLSSIHGSIIFRALSLSSRSPMIRSKRPTILGDTLYAAKTPFAQIHPVNRSIETRQLMVFAGLYPIDSNASFYGYDRMINMPSRSGLDRRSICGGRIEISKGKTWMVKKPVDFPSVCNRADGVEVIE
ncbi:Translation factor guf1 mitochondrial [Puccinia graminis f. sp. tritici]|uniref:Translation factor guf1 mitochondrial n=1 Tax=Puccinia graminis f. sp. tritici TaxID=56615 RepID=A0A5B0MNX1_PUCGR|nr:Translation factor guf1 mitochondrial [Puccinia graminis f. sp. tritici]